MKRVFGILLILILITAGFGCGKPDPAEIQTEYLAMLQEPATEETIQNVGSFLDDNLSRIKTDDADHMVIAYEDYIFSFDSTKLVYRDFLDRFNKYISDPLVALYNIKIEEQENPMAVDTVLQMSWNQLCERALKLELFIKENKDNKVVKEDAIWLYANYISAMIKGTTGTPIFSYKTGEFSAEAKDAYIAFAAVYPDTVVTYTLNEYFSYLVSIKEKLNYNDPTESKVFFDTCAYLVSEAGKRVSE